MDQIELYRETRESIAQGLEAGAWHSLPHAARDRALLAELKAEGNLHPALFPADETSPDIIGHYKVGTIAYFHRSKHITNQCLPGRENCLMGSGKIDAEGGELQGLYLHSFVLCRCCRPFVRVLLPSCWSEAIIPR